MNQEKTINRQRRRRRFRVRNRVVRDSTRPRLSVYRSHKNMSAQVIDDEKGVTLVSASTADAAISKQLKYGGNVEAAAAVGKLLAQRALDAGIKQVAFDRRDYRYHGRVAALADAARESGLEF
ncbi:MAG: 50S ribosomal protein L18 [Pirellulales bacterium]|nr:50S ribosomal protein L18 [Planctomycetales bacterium]